MRLIFTIVVSLFPLFVLCQDKKKEVVESKTREASHSRPVKSSSKIEIKSTVKNEADMTYDKKVALSIAILSLGLSMFNFVKQMNIASDNRDISRIEDAYKKWTDEDFINSRRWIVETLRQKYPQSETQKFGYYNLKKADDDDVNKITSVSVFFDYVGLFMSNRLFNEKLFWEFWGEAVIMYWEILSPYLFVQRQMIKERYTGDKKASAEYKNGQLTDAAIEKKATERAIQYQMHFENLAILCSEFSRKTDRDGQFTKGFSYLTKKKLRRKPIDYLN